MKHLLYAIGLLCLALTFSACQNSQGIEDNVIVIPDGEMPDGIIYFTKVNGKKADLEKVNIDGTGYSHIRTGALISQYPINGNIVYNVLENNRKLCKSAWDGSNEQAVIEYTEECTKFISPDGKYTLSAYEKDSIVSHNNSTGEDIRISTNYGGTFFLEIAPDGTKIAYIEKTGAEDSGILYVCNFDGTGKVKLSEDVYYQNDMPYYASWSRDSKYIVARDGLRMKVLIFKTDGTESYTIDSEGGEVLYPAISPDNMTVAYTDGVDLVTNNLQGTDRKTLAKGDKENHYVCHAPVFSPDGKYIAYIYGNDNGDVGVYSYNVSSGENKLLVKPDFGTTIVDPYLMPRLYWFEGTSVQ